MKRETFTILSLAFLSFALGVAIVYLFFRGGSGAHEHSDTLTENLQSGISGETVIYLSVRHGESRDEYVLYDDGLWRTEDGREIQQTYPITSLSALSCIEGAIFVSSDKDADAGYGFSTPTLEVVAVTSDKKRVTYTVGAKNYLTGMYYFTIGRTVYLIDGTFLEYFDYTADEIAL